MFGCLTYLRADCRRIAAAAVLLLMGPRMWLLLPTWWLGVVLYRRLDPLRLSRGAFGVSMMALAVAGYAAFLGSGFRNTTDVASVQLYALFNQVLPSPFLKGESGHVLSDYVVAGLFAAFVVGCSNCGFAFGPRSARAVRALAGYTFTFYLIHFSLLALIQAIGVSRPPDWSSYFAILGAIFAATWGLAQVGEQRRLWYRRLFARLWRLGAPQDRRREPSP